MACPFFMPMKPLESSLFPHPARLPLGDAYGGVCTAPGHEGAVPRDESLHDCNLGYARCAWLPAERSCDAVRLLMGRDRDGCYAVHYACELAHAPAAHGLLEFDRGQHRWRAPHPNACLQRMADCCLQSYLRRRTT
jgi:hypothetical protein